MGYLPLAGDFRPVGETNTLYPLAIDGCTRCGILQVRDTVPADVLFHPRYSYASSSVPGLVRHFEDYAREAGSLQREAVKLLEIGCNDGVFLDALRRVGFTVYGIDASDNVAELARQKGHDVITSLFSSATADDVLGRWGSFDVITCSNVFAHNPSVNTFIDGVAKLLRPNGEFWIEVHSGETLREGLQWDFFYHEHCFYWTLASLQSCLLQHGFRLKHARRTPMHGGSIRAVFVRGSDPRGDFPEIAGADSWLGFGAECRRSREIIYDVVSRLPINFAYGASGRAVILLNWTGLQHELEFAVDGSPLRFGKAIPGSRMPIISEADFYSRPAPNWCFVTAHNYFDEIKSKVTSRFLHHLIRFVRPLPRVEVE